MNIKKIALLTVAVSALASCGIQPAELLVGRIIKDDVTVDHFPGIEHSVEDMRAGIWIDGNGCEHWIIDDGVEGYMSPRWASNGEPVCNVNNIPYTTRNFNRSSWGSESKSNY